MEGILAEENAAKDEQSSAGSQDGTAKKKKPWLLIALVAVNFLAVVAVGFIVYLGQKKIEESQNPIGDPEKTEVEQIVEDESTKPSIISLDTFLVNLVDGQWRKLMKVNMELEVVGDGIVEEVTKQMPKIRDMIITIISSKLHTDISSKEGKEFLRNEIKDQINLFLTKGKIEQIFFTEFIYN